MKMYNDIVRQEDINIFVQGPHMFTVFGAKKLKSDPDNNFKQMHTYMVIWVD